MKTLGLVFASIITLTISSAVFAKSAPELPEGIKRIAEGKYAEALSILQAGHYDSSQAAEAHYYKGIALSHLHRKDEAEKEYKLAKFLDTSGKIAAFAQTALDNMSGTNNPAKTNLPNNSTGSAGKPDPSAEVRACAQRIMSQSSERINRIFSDEYIPPIRSNYHTLKYAHNSPGSDGRPGDWCGTGRIPKCANQWTNPGPGQDWRRLYNPDRYAYHPGDYKRNPNDPQWRHLSHKANNVASSAEGLVTLLTREDNGKGVFLKPEGTNLYVRNYEYGAAIDPPPPVGIKTDVPMLSLPKPLKKIANSKI